MSDSSEASPVITIDFKTVNKPVVTKGAPKFGECQHKTFALDEIAHTVECSKCGKVVDPFYALLQIAKDASFRDYRLNEWKAYEQRQKEIQEKNKVKFQKSMDRLNSREGRS